MTDELAAPILAWILERVDAGPAEVEARTPLLEEGRLDSLQIVELVNFIESRFGVAIDLEEMLPENFETVEHIVAMVRRAPRA